MPDLYYANTDENKVLCVERVVDIDTEGKWTVDQVADQLAGQYPEVIYFEVGRYFCDTYQCGSCNGCRTAGQKEGAPDV